MKTSESIKEIFTALALVQSQINPVKKDGANPFFKSKYVTLNNVLDEVIKNLSQFDLCLIQTCTHNGLATRLVHTKSGEWIEDTATIDNIPNDAQKYGSLITYLRRYSIKSIFLMQDTDDDGNRATREPVNNKPKQSDSVPAQISRGYKACVKAGHDFKGELEGEFMSGNIAQQKANLDKLTSIYNAISKVKK